MITSTTGLTLNHGWIRGYRYMGNPDYPTVSQEFLDNKGFICIFIIDGVVQHIESFYTPLASLFLAEEKTIVDMDNFTIQITANGVTETIVFDEVDEKVYAILVSNPLVMEMTRTCTNNCACQVGWKWNGEVFHE